MNKVLTSIVVVFVVAAVGCLIYINNFVEPSDYIVYEEPQNEMIVEKDIVVPFAHNVQAGILEPVDESENIYIYKDSEERLSFVFDGNLWFLDERVDGIDSTITNTLTVRRQTSITYGAKIIMEFSKHPSFDFWRYYRGENGESQSIMFNGEKAQAFFDIEISDIDGGIPVYGRAIFLSDRGVLIRTNEYTNSGQYFSGNELESLLDGITFPDTPVATCGGYYNPDLVEVDVSDWETYTHPNHGYSFKYPPSLRIEWTDSSSAYLLQLTEWSPVFFINTFSAEPPPGANRGSDTQEKLSAPLEEFAQSSWSINKENEGGVFQGVEKTVCPLEEVVLDEHPAFQFSSSVSARALVGGVLLGDKEVVLLMVEDEEDKHLISFLSSEHDVISGVLSSFRFND